MIQEIRKRLRQYRKENIEFNDPHFTEQMILRGGRKQEVIDNILDPKRLAYVCEEFKGKTVVHDLHFKISNTRTMRLPVIFDKDGQKGLYILTYIMRYRAWQNMIRK